MFQWDDANQQHIARHRLTPAEVELALRDGYAVELYTTVEDDEERAHTVGATPLGRILFVVTTERDELIRVVTARNANPQEAREYLRRRGPWT